MRCPPPRHLTICECRPPWHEDGGPDWSRFPIARLHYTEITGLWTLYWRDHESTTMNSSSPAAGSKTYSTTSITAPTPFSGADRPDTLST